MNMRPAGLSGVSPKVLVILLCLAVYFALTACGREQATAPPAATPVPAKLTQVKEPSTMPLSPTPAPTPVPPEPVLSTDPAQPVAVDLLRSKWPLVKFAVKRERA